MKRLLVLLVALWLAGCAGVSRIQAGDTTVANRLAVKIDADWNQLTHKIVPTAVTWTVEGITIDSLNFYVGLKDGEALAPAPKDGKPLVFKSAMQPHEIVTLYQGLHSRDGSQFELVRLEPADFLGGKGFRFEYAVIRKYDDVRLRGMAYGIVRQGELFVIDYSAPRLAFFGRHQASVEAIVKTARVAQ